MPVSDGLIPESHRWGFHRLSGSLEVRPSRCVLRDRVPRTRPLVRGSTRLGRQERVRRWRTRRGNGRLLPVPGTADSGRGTTRQPQLVTQIVAEGNARRPQLHFQSELKRARSRTSCCPSFRKKSQLRTRRPRSRMTTTAYLQLHLAPKPNHAHQPTPQLLQPNGQPKPQPAPAPSLKRALSKSRTASSPCSTGSTTDHLRLVRCWGWRLGEVEDDLGYACGRRHRACAYQLARHTLDALPNPL